MPLLLPPRLTTDKIVGTEGLVLGWRRVVDKAVDEPVVRIVIGVVRIVIGVIRGRRRQLFGAA